MPAKRLIFAVLILFACGGKDRNPGKTYFDLKGYFTAEAHRLKTLKTHVTKSVSRNGTSEIKGHTSPDWNTDFSLFDESDINKPAWSTSYNVHQQDSTITYTARDSALRTRSIIIRKNKEGRVVYVSVLNKTKNYLYSSSEQLLYIPDSLYRIEKIQDVILLGTNSYIISGIVE